MNYDIYQDSDGVDPIFISSFETPAEFRPRIGDHVTLPNDLRIFKVNRASPSDNPDDQKVIYYVEQYIENMFPQCEFIVDDNPKHF